MFRLTFALMVCLAFGLMAEALSAASLPKDKTHANTIGMKLVRVEGGSFMMGSAIGGDFDEQPAHRVKITQPFYMAATEVTNAQYEQFDPAHKKLRGRNGLSKADDEAVIFVSWNDAARFCQWLSEKEGLPYRLPTEAEWEYACRAGTTTLYNTGGILPAEYQKNQKMVGRPKPVPLNVGRTPANAWGIHDMHGNVEEWCHDWYGPYTKEEQIDPIGRAEGDFRVTRGGSHNTEVRYLRSANRLGTMPQDAHYLIGFRVVMGELPKTKPLPATAPELWARNVSQKRHDWPGGPDPSKPYFKALRDFVIIPPGSNGPLFSKHNHQPAITPCPNGDLLAIWFSTNSEAGREMGVVASRLRLGAEDWDPAAPFWDAPDRNETGSALWWDGKDTLYHFNGLNTDATWDNLALVMRTSTDNGVTWSKARIISPHGTRNPAIAGVIGTRDGRIFVQCDILRGGTAVHISKDGGKTWTDPGKGKRRPRITAGGTGPWIAGIHAGLVELKDGRLMALGRYDAIDSQAPRSISADGGKTWTYSPSGLRSIGMARRLTMLRLNEGPIFVASFMNQTLKDAAGRDRRTTGLFGAISLDEGKTWPIRRLITDDAPPHHVYGGGNTHMFILGPNTAEPAGYMASCQTPDGVIHLISSRLHYQFNLAWLKTRMPAAVTSGWKTVYEEPFRVTDKYAWSVKHKGNGYKTVLKTDGDRQVLDMRTPTPGRSVVRIATEISGPFAIEMVAKTLGLPCDMSIFMDGIGTGPAFQFGGGHNTINRLWASGHGSDGTEVKKTDLPTDVLIEQGKWHRVRLEVRDGAVFGYVDGKQIGRVPLGAKYNWKAKHVPLLYFVDTRVLIDSVSVQSLVGKAN